MNLDIDKMDLHKLLASHIRSSYVMLRRLRRGEKSYTLHPKWDGGEDSRGRRHKSVWPGIAEFMFAHRLNVHACMSLCFQLNEERCEAPMPSAIAAPRLLEDYLSVSRIDAEQLVFTLRAEKQLCRVELHEAAQNYGINGKPAWLYVLGNEDLSLSPLFRFCLAYSEDLDELANEYKLDAILQYVVAMDAYDRAWEDWIPDKFRKQVRTAYNRSVTHRKDHNGEEDKGTTKGRGKKTTARRPTEGDDAGGLST